MTKRRQDHEPPASIAEWGWKYHHLGIPTRRKLADEIYLPQFKFFVSGFSTSPFGIEWMRFKKDSPVSKLIMTIPHIAFEVRDIDHEILTHNLKVLTKPNSPGNGIRVAMVEHDGAPVELIEFDNSKLILIRGAQDLKIS
jgi:hypothetical protein